MVTVEFFNFGAMLVMWLILLRLGQIVFANTWVSSALGALHA